MCKIISCNLEKEYSCVFDIEFGCWSELAEVGNEWELAPTLTVSNNVKNTVAYYA